MYQRPEAQINPKTLSNSPGNYRRSVMTSQPGNHMRDRRASEADLKEMVFDHVVFNNLMGGSMTYASLIHATKDAQKAM